MVKVFLWCGGSLLLRLQLVYSIHSPAGVVWYPQEILSTAAIGTIWVLVYFVHVPVHTRGGQSRLTFTNQVSLKSRVAQYCRLRAFELPLCK